MGGLSETAYAVFVGAIVGVLCAVYQRDPERTNFGLWETTRSYGGFLLASVLASCLVGASPWKAVFTLVVLNILAYIQHLLAHKIIPKAVPRVAFHDSVHHSARGHRPINILREFVTNFMGTSMLVAPICLLVLDLRVSILFGFTYASYHLVNQRLLGSPQHRLHHEAPDFNLGWDYMDVLFNTKGDARCEDLNTGIINILVGTLLIVGWRAAREGGVAHKKKESFSGA